MHEVRGIRAKYFTADREVETEPTLLYGIILVCGTAATQGIVNAYNGQGTDRELIASFAASRSRPFFFPKPIRFSTGLYFDMDSNITGYTVLWLTTEQAARLYPDG